MQEKTGRLDIGRLDDRRRCRHVPADELMERRRVIRLIRLTGSGLRRRRQKTLGRDLAVLELAGQGQDVIHDGNGRAHRPVGQRASEPLIADDASRDPEPHETLDDGDPRVHVELVAAEPDAALIVKIVERVAVFPPVQAVVEGGVEEIAQRLALGVGAQGRPEAPPALNVVGVLEDPREVIRRALMVRRTAVVARFVQAPFAVDVLDLVELGIRGGGELAVVDVLQGRVPGRQQLERRFVRLEVALADVPMRDGIEVPPAVQRGDVRPREAQRFARRLAVQLDLAPAPHR